MTRYQTRPYFSSSRSWASTMAQGGIFDTAGNSAFGNANRVYVKYCSSDLWAGALPASQANPGGFAFMGSRIVSGVISALVANHGLGAGHRLLFGGCSAGAIGAMHNLDAVSTQLASTGVEVKGLLDAAALVDIYPSGWAWSPDLLPLQTLVAELVALLKPTFPAVCAERGYTGENEWRCLFSAYRLPLLTTPFFANAVQFDDFEIQYETNNLGPSNQQQLDFVESFQPAYLDLIASLPPGSGVYSPTCLVHCLTGQNSYFQFTVNGISMGSALNDWYFNGATSHVVSGCQGWSCTQQCGVDEEGIPCNIGGPELSCSPVSLPTSSPSEEPPATEDAVLVTPSVFFAQQAQQQAQQAQQQAQQVAQQNGQLAPAQQANMEQFQAGQEQLQQLQGRRSLLGERHALAAATRSGCCAGAEDGDAADKAVFSS